MSTSSSVATPWATASTARSTIRATVRATIIPGTSPMTLTFLPSAWNSPVACATVSAEVCAAWERAMRVALR